MYFTQLKPIVIYISYGLCSMSDVQCVCDLPVECAPLCEVDYYCCCCFYFVFLFISVMAAKCEACGVQDYFPYRTVKCIVYHWDCFRMWQNMTSSLTGCETSSAESRCTETWAECKYPDKDSKYQKIDVVHAKQIKHSMETNVWENKRTIFLYHDSEQKRLRVVFTQRKKDIKAFQCKFYQTPGSTPKNKELEFENGKKKEKWLFSCFYLDVTK